MSGWRAWLALSAALLLPCAAGAQVVHGTVVHAVDSTPLPGVVVMLVAGAAGDNVVDRALTDENGAFRLDGTRPGTFRIRTLRIGFRPVTTPPFELRSLEQATRRIEIAGLPVSLEAVQVAARSVCRDFADDTIGPAAIWQQARTALTAAELTSRARTLEATIVTYTRVLDPHSERVRQHSASVRSGLSSRVWTAHPLQSLRERGYVRDDPDGGTTYFAPDLAILMSDAFVEDHCFHVVLSRNPALIGIAFEPTRERRRVPEIAGTVWLDRKTSELRRMEFGYVNVSKEKERAGGDMTFVRLGTGGWVISRWNIRMPAIERRVRNTVGGMRGAETTVDERLIETRVSGGELALVMRRGDTLWKRPPMTLRGIVTDSATGIAVSGARVGIRGMALGTVSAGDGSFVLQGMLPGDYTLEVATPAMQALGQVHRQGVRFADTLSTHQLRLPSPGRRPR